MEQKTVLAVQRAISAGGDNLTRPHVLGHLQYADPDLIEPWVEACDKEVERLKARISEIDVAVELTLAAPPEPLTGLQQVAHDAAIAAGGTTERPSGDGVAGD